jgi:hypothetical protein
MRDKPKVFLLTQSEKLLLLTMLREKTHTMRQDVDRVRRLLDTPTLGIGERFTIAKNLESLEAYLKVSEGMLTKVMRTPALG